MLIILDSPKVAQRLETLIAKHRAKRISVAEIKRRIYETDNDDVMAENNRFIKWWMKCFPRLKSDTDFSELLQAFQDAWNVFPHRSLSGKSPQQVLQEEMEKHTEIKNDDFEKDMPDVIVGGQTMPWDDYRAMIRKMEKLQKPFKKWIDEIALPAYKKNLETRYKSPKTIGKHYDVADYFFQRALHVGFLTFEQIRPAFAVWEFPAWWPDHILYSNLSDDQVWHSLCDFLWFLEIQLQKIIPGVLEEAAGERKSPEDDVILSPQEPLHITKTGRNDPCPCGSGKKYKRCCGA